MKSGTGDSEPEDRETAQADLYHQLGQQLNRFLSSGNGKAEPRDPSVEEPAPAKEHWCNEHQTEFKRQPKANAVWYSHRTENGWCNEPRAVG